MGADVLEEAARQLAAEGAARKAAEGRVAELQRQLAERGATARRQSDSLPVTYVHSIYLHSFYPITPICPHTIVP